MSEDAHDAKETTMTTVRTILALALTFPIYLGSLLFIRHGFTREWEAAARSLLGR